MLATSLLLWFHPYRGIWHDSAVYLGQALALLHPDAFKHDLFFAFGSQAAYTVFPNALAWLIERLDSGPVFLWLALLGLLAFLFASWQLIRKLLPESVRLPGLLALILLPASYGAWGILSYAEPFLTGRSFAEPLVLAGLAALVGGRTWLAGCLCALAIALHPLQAPSIIALAWFWAVQRDRRWLHLLWSVPLALLACLLVPRLHFLVARMDSLWFGQVWQRSLVVFYTHSAPADWFYLLKDVFIAGVAAHHARGILRRYLIAVLAATATLFAAGIVLSDLLHLAWPSALQLWRVHWVLHWSATALLPWICVHLWRQDPAGWPRLLVFASVVVLGLIPAAAHPAVPALALLYLAWPRLEAHVSLPLRQLIGLLSAAIACWHLAPQAWRLLPWAGPTEMLPWTDAISQPRMPALLALLAALAAAWAWHRASDRTRMLSLPLLGLLLVYAAGRWDQQSDLQRVFTSTMPNDGPFGVRILPHEQVLWLGNLLPAWSVLHRPHYIQQQQLSGIVFNRQTSIEGFRRKALMDVTDGKGNDCRIVVFPKDPYAACKPDDTAMRQACARARGQLSWFVLYYPLRAPTRGTWTPGDGTSGTYYLYACQDFIGPAPADGGARTD